MPPESASTAARHDERPVLALTGATGFIGGAVAAHFASAGWRVRALVRNPPRAAGLASFGVDIVPGDIGDADCLGALVESAAAVIHCAGAVRGLTDEDFFRANAEGVANLAAAASRQSPQPVFLALSSLAAREPDISAYAASKRAGEDALAEAAGEMPWVVLRPPAVYGAGDQVSLPLLRSLMRGLVLVPGSPRNRFSLIHVDDLVGAIGACISHGPALAGNTFELHDGTRGGYDWNALRDIGAEARGGAVRMVVVPTRVLAAAARLNTSWGRISRRAPLLTLGKVAELGHANWVSDNAALNAACGWVPGIDFSTGLRLTLGKS